MTNLGLQVQVRGRTPDSARKRFQTLSDGASLVVFTGDFNFCAGWPAEQTLLDPRWEDSWTLQHPGDPGFTFDTEVKILSWGSITTARGHLRFLSQF